MTRPSQRILVTLAVAMGMGACQPEGALRAVPATRAATDSGPLGRRTATALADVPAHPGGGDAVSDKVVKDEAEWRALLTPEQYHVMREAGTERAFSGKYWNHKESGVYRCAACGAPLFRSQEKFDSGTGWPSFWAPYAQENVRTETDRSFGMRRTEVLCSRCASHLGHVFEDGPEPTGLRYCINSAALEFERDE